MMRWLWPVVLASILVSLVIVAVQPYRSQDFTLEKLAELNTPSNVAAVFVYHPASQSPVILFYDPASHNIYEWNFLYSFSARVVANSGGGASGAHTYLDVVPPSLSPGTVYSVGTYNLGGISFYSAPYTRLRNYAGGSATVLAGLHVGSRDYIFQVEGKTLEVFDGSQVHTLYTCSQQQFGVDHFSYGYLPDGDGIFAVYIHCGPSIISANSCVQDGVTYIYRISHTSSSVTPIYSHASYAGTGSLCIHHHPIFIHYHNSAVYVLDDSHSVHRYTIDINSNNVYDRITNDNIPYGWINETVRLGDPTADVYIPGHGWYWAIPYHSGTFSPNFPDHLVLVPYSPAYPTDYYTIPLDYNDYEVYVRNISPDYFAVVYTRTVLPDSNHPSAHIVVYRFAPPPDYSVSNVHATYDSNVLRVSFDVNGPSSPVAYTVSITSDSNDFNAIVLDSNTITPPATYSHDFHVYLAPADYNIIVDLNVSDANTSNNSATYLLTVSQQSTSSSSGSSSSSSSSASSSSSSSSTTSSSSPSSLSPTSSTSSSSSSPSHRSLSVTSLALYLFWPLLLIILLFIYIYFHYHHQPSKTP